MKLDSEQTVEAARAEVQGLLRAHVADWLAGRRLSAPEVDCANAVMLKILDGKCKMPADEKRVMRELYRQLERRCGRLLGPSVHELVEAAGERPDEAMRSRIYEQRVLAETAIARPVMKAFKAMIRSTGLLDTVRGARRTV
jgi:hypothetical protein